MRHAEIRGSLRAFAGDRFYTTETTTQVRKAFAGLDLGRRRTIVDALMTITVNPVGKGTGPVFNPDAIDVAWNEDL